MFIATLNKTLKSYFFAIIGAEYVFVGFNRYSLLGQVVKPNYLIDISKKYNLEIDRLDGVNLIF